MNNAVILPLCAAGGGSSDMLDAPFPLAVGLTYCLAASAAMVCTVVLILNA